KLDLFLAGAVVEKGKVRDLLLRNEGGTFRDVTHEMKLADHPASLGAFAADYDNDGFTDLLLTGVSGVRLFHNEAGPPRRYFADVTKKASLAELSGVCLGATWVDLDQDGDLDLLICQYAANPQEAIASLKDPSKKKGPGLAIFRNIGEAKPDITTEYF